MPEEEIARPRVLVAVNSATYSESLASLLERKGFDVVRAGNAEEVQQVVDPENLPDLMLVDRGLRANDDDDSQYPSSGHGVAQRFGRESPVILMASNPVGDTVLQAIRSNAAGFFAKGEFETPAEQLSDALRKLVKEGGALFSGGALQTSTWSSTAAAHSQVESDAVVHLSREELAAMQTEAGLNTPGRPGRDGDTHHDRSGL